MKIHWGIQSKTSVFSNRDVEQYGFEFELVSRKFLEEQFSFFMNGTVMESRNQQPDGSSATKLKSM